MKFSRWLIHFLAGASGMVAHAGSPKSSEAVQEKVESPWEFAVSADVGWREDHFEWTIAGDLTGANPNILSELDWRHLNIIPTGGQLEATFRKVWHLRLGGGYGRIVNGDNRDSDFDFNDHRGEFSRSVADTHGAATDGAFEFARDFRISPAMILSPLVGFSYHRLRLNDRNGVQVVDTEFHDLGPFDGLDSVYDAHWWGPVFGLEGRVKLAERWRWLAGARYELLRYHGHSDWNLRTDLVNFHHTADGGGWILSTGVEWDLSNRWTLALLGEYVYRSTGNGIDVTEFSDHSLDYTQQNGSNWESFGARVRLTYRF